MIDVILLYSKDVIYIGETEVSNKFDTGNVNNGILLGHPFILNIKVIPNEEEPNKLDSVMVDLLLPIEFAGIALSDKFYTGFVSLTPASTNDVLVSVELNGNRFIINKLNSLTDLDIPAIKVYDIAKVMSPSSQLKKLYYEKLSIYNDILRGPRMVDYQVLPPATDITADDIDLSEKINSNVVNFHKSKTKH